MPRRLLIPKCPPQVLPAAWLPAGEDDDLQYDPATRRFTPVVKPGAPDNRRLQDPDE